MRRSRGFGRKALLVACAMALAVAFVLPAADAEAFSEPIPTKISLLKWGGNPRVGKLYKIVSKAPNPPLFALPDAVTSDPVTNGGSVKVTVGAGTLECTLPGGASWKALGNPAGSKGYKYVNKAAPVGDLCKIVIVKEKVIKVLAKGVGGIALPGDPGTNPDVKMTLNVGLDSYCAEAKNPHFKEKADTLIKMKAQPAPASCEGCGDNIVNGDPLEECDGTDDSACPGACIPPGGGGVTCGDDVRNGGLECTCAVEQCDGADAPLCPGICNANCTCPEPICNNGVKEAGEVCDPAGSTADCSGGQVCGGFCECVDDLACDCGTPDPTMYMFRDLPPAPGQLCGSTDGTASSGPNPNSDQLKCMGLYIGGGGGALPVPAVIPDEALPKYDITQCKGSDITLGPLTQAEVGSRHCTEGTHCVGGTNDGLPCLRDLDCPLGGCEARCFFTTYVANLDRALPVLSTCLATVMAEDGSGGVDCATGKTFTRVPMDVRVHLTLADQSPSTNGHQACPICYGGTVNVADSGICEGGPRNGLPCMPMSTAYDARSCCQSGPETQEDCTDDSDCPGSTCQPGCSSYPSSLDCPPNPLNDVGGLFVTLNLNTEDENAFNNTVVANGEGEFCGWCRDVLLEGSNCFEGDRDAANGGQFCPDSAVIACRPATYWAGIKDPADIVECNDPVPCRSDLDCTAPYETCTQRNPGASRDATIKTQVYNAGARPIGDLTDKSWHGDSVMVTNICIPPTYDGSKDGQSDLPGPGGISILAEARLSPSGAFMETANGLLD